MLGLWLPRQCGVVAHCRAMSTTTTTTTTTAAAAVTSALPSSSEPQRVARFAWPPALASTPAALGAVAPADPEPEADSDAAKTRGALKMARLVELCKRRGFVFRSGEIYGGGLQGCYDYGHAGVELKSNLAGEWWRAIVRKSRGRIVGIDSSIMSSYKVWKASGHVAQFNDRMGICALSGLPFRVDKAPPLRIDTVRPRQQEADHATAVAAVPQQHRVVKLTAPDAQHAARWAAKLAQDGDAASAPADNSAGSITFANADGSAGKSIPYPPAAVPKSNSPFFEEKLMNGMFPTSEFGTDILNEAATVASSSIAQKPTPTNADQVRQAFAASIAPRLTYLRPETAQGIFMQTTNTSNANILKLPFGIAQIGKAFRNEIDAQHFIFRSREFEQMELEFFIPPGDHEPWLQYWVNSRTQWWRSLLRNPDDIVQLPIPKRDLAHYARACVDLEYNFPWGRGELEGVAARGSHDLDAHEAGSGANLRVPGAQPGSVVVPHVIEPSAGLTRGVLAVLCDALHEVGPGDPRYSDKSSEQRLVLALHPRLAPYKAALLPVVAKEPLMEAARNMEERLVNEFGLAVIYDDARSIGKRYQRQDELGTPLCVAFDSEGITVRNRDTSKSERMSEEDAIQLIVSTARLPLAFDALPPLPRDVSLAAA
ncbi:glycyl-tRNA synthetase [Capsaspora owczarzaki ATCC 30864]|uniref:glycyl-tRNA synthetase n=1 Tax=Capsaspora owczarzaki (strain ATCC 30864) TaxID=595528 RepID=UPI00035240D2|nr:glycyl-tRNA synthetase [Capsaspora owczarzaki ATCC 30864]|eukprot:XP_004343361.2 glycyl-tRNA synthetase [Capsaspora owczarzaki ATCC 30864]